MFKPMHLVCLALCGSLFILACDLSSLTSFLPGGEASSQPGAPSTVPDPIACENQKLPFPIAPNAVNCVFVAGTATYTTPWEPGIVIKFYAESLARDGWTLEFSDDTIVGKIAGWHKGNASLQVAASPHQNVTAVIVGTASTGAPSSPQPTATQPAAKIATPGATAPIVTAPAAGFTLKLPDGQSLKLAVSSCRGVRAGEYLEVSATNLLSDSDPNLVQIQVAGNHQAASRVEKMYLEVQMGPKNKRIFNGNTLSAQMTVAANGTGRFADVSVVNAAVDSPKYQYAKEFKFSGEWTCKP